MKKDLKTFKSRWVEYLSKNLKNFPEDFLNNVTAETLEMPSKSLLPGDIFFGKFEIVDSNSVVQFKVEDRYKYKYLIYASRNKPAKTLIPINQNDIKQVVLNYETYLRSIVKKMKSDYKLTFNTTQNFNEFAGKVFKYFNIQLF